MGFNETKLSNWPYDCSNTHEAQQLATGKGITVAILDHLFVKTDYSLKNRTIKPKSMLGNDDSPFTSVENLGHGTWMARILVKVAPGIKIIPIKICGDGHYGDADLYINGIKYAISNGADIISLSQEGIPKDRIEDFDQAVGEAIRKNVAIVFINYNGQNPNVIIPQPIEFANKYSREGSVFVVGTNYFDRDSFPYTWGVSYTAPFVSGIIALIKELNPDMPPVQIKKILMQSNRNLLIEYPLVDAHQAVQHSKN